MKKAKKIIFGLILSLFVLSLNAQTGAGNLLIGGSSNLNISPFTVKYKSDNGDGTAGKITSINLSPQVGYFVINGLAAGLTLDVSWVRQKEDGAEDPSINTSIMAAPFARYYFNLGDSKFKPFGEASVGLGTDIFKYTDINDDTQKVKTGMFGFEIKGGVAAFLNDNISVDLSVGFSSLSEKDKEDNPNNEKIIYNGVIFDIGIMVVL